MLRLLLCSLIVALVVAKTSLKGKVALITGASSGIGKVVAKELGKQGMKVILTARRIDKLQENVEDINKAGGEAVAFKCDVSISTSIEWAFAFAEEKYGGVDFVFANAGVEGGLSHKALVDQDDQMEINNLFDINVVGQVETLKYAVKSFTKRSGGTIVFSSSNAAFCAETCGKAHVSQGMPRGHGIAYAASKSALDMVASGAAGAYGDLGINVYNLNIAMFETEMGTRLGFDDLMKAGQGAPFNPINKKQPGNPIHIAECIIAMLDGTTKWAPGQAILIDNDMTVDAKYFYDKIKDPGAIEYFGFRSPEELKKYAMDVKGEPYKFKDEL